MRRTILIMLLALSLIMLIITPLLIFTPVGRSIFTATSNTALEANARPWPTRTPSAPTPTPTPILTAQGATPQLNAKASYLLDLDTGHVLEDVNGEQPMPMASTTKVMTALIAIQTADLNQTITVQQDAIDHVGYHSYGTDGSTAHLQVGEALKLKDLLYALLLPSGDDAAVAIADSLGGSTSNFVYWMNLFAYRLHLFQTHYVNVDGLTNPAQDSDHYTSAADLARLTRYALQVPLFAQIVSTPMYSIAGHVWTSTNDLLYQGADAYNNGAYHYNGITGVKTGHTHAAGYCLAFAAVRDGHHLLGVVLNSPTQDTRDQDAIKLLDWGFALPILPPAS